MTDETTFDPDGRPRVRVVRRYPHPVAKVWLAVTSPDHLGAWFPSPVEIDLRRGGAMRFQAFDGDVAATGTVEEVDAPRLLSFSWGDDRMTFELEPDGDGTVLTLTHAFDDRAGAASVATGWEICLRALHGVLADEPVTAPDRGIDRHEELVHEFGLDRPDITTSDGGWTVRYARQLTCPAAIAWDLWFGIDTATGRQRGAPAVGAPLTPCVAPDVVIGTMTEVQLHRVLAFDVAPGGGPGDHVRVELGDGSGHGTRLTLVVRGTDPDQMASARDEWGTGAVGHLAAMAAEWARAEANGA